MAYSKKRSGSEKRKRSPIIGFRASDEERAQIEAAAERAGLTVGSYVRSRALAKPTTRAVRRPPVETVQLAHLLGMMGAVGGTIRGLAEKHGGAEGIPPVELQHTLAAFREAAAAILQALGKRAALARDRSP
jgi:mobilization protein NikA